MTRSLDDKEYQKNFVLENKSSQHYGYLYNTIIHQISRVVQ